MALKSKKDLYENIYKDNFSFGKNWEKYLKRISNSNLNEARNHLTSLFGKEKLKEKTIIDFGCGSGLFSLASFLEGAKKVMSVDIDPSSIKCASKLKKSAINLTKGEWVIKKGSALDLIFINQLGKYDIVYSWGVLHHTGDMWTAIDNVSKLVKPHGVFMLAIYNKRKGFQSSEFWKNIKKVYSQSNFFLRKIIEMGYISQFFTMGLIKFENRIKYITQYKKERGMNWYRDMVDWLGGYPYEFASTEEVTSYLISRGFKLIKLKNVGDGTGCNEFIFRKI